MKFNQFDENNLPDQRKKDKEKFGKYFGQHLRKVRDSKGMTQEELSVEAGYYRTYVNKIEQGYYSPSLHTVWRLARTLGMSLSDFFKNFK